MTAASNKESLRPDNQGYDDDKGMSDNQGYDDEKGMSDPTSSPLKIKMDWLPWTFFIFLITIFGSLSFGEFVFGKIYDKHSADTDWMIIFVTGLVFFIFITALWFLACSFLFMVLIMEICVSNTGFEELSRGLRECKMLAYWLSLPSLVVLVVSTVVLLSI